MTTSLRMNQFYKTKTCPWFFKGRCERGDSCRFAHNEQEKRDLPDLSRTSFCPMLLKHGICQDAQCRFAHNVDQLRATDDMYKTSLCFMFMKSRCEAGSQCRHAHGTHELRAAPTTLPESELPSVSSNAGVLTPTSMAVGQGGSNNLPSTLPRPPQHQSFNANRQQYSQPPESYAHQLHRHNGRNVSTKERKSHRNNSKHSSNSSLIHSQPTLGQATTPKSSLRDLLMQSKSIDMNMKLGAHSMLTGTQLQQAQNPQQNTHQLSRGRRNSHPVRGQRNQLGRSPKAVDSSRSPHISGKTTPTGAAPNGIGTMNTEGKGLSNVTGDKKEEKVRTDGSCSAVSNSHTTDNTDSQQNGSPSASYYLKPSLSNSPSFSHVVTSDPGIGACGTQNRSFMPNNSSQQFESSQFISSSLPQPPRLPPFHPLLPGLGPPLFSLSSNFPVVASPSPFIPKQYPPSTNNEGRSPNHSSGPEKSNINGSQQVASSSKDTCTPSGDHTEQSDSAYQFDQTQFNQAFAYLSSNEQMVNALTLLSSFSQQAPLLPHVNPPFVPHQQYPQASAPTPARDVWQDPACPKTTMESTFPQNRLFSEGNCSASVSADEGSNSDNNKAESIQRRMEGYRLGPMELESSLSGAALMLQHLQANVITAASTGKESPQRTLISLMGYPSSAAAVVPPITAPKGVDEVSKRDPSMMSNMNCQFGINSQVETTMTNNPPEGLSDVHHQRMMQYAYEVYLSQIQAASLVAYQQQVRSGQQPQGTSVPQVQVPTLPFPVAHIPITQALPIPLQPLIPQPNTAHILFSAGHPACTSINYVNSCTVNEINPQQSECRSSIPLRRTEKNNTSPSLSEISLDGQTTDTGLGTSRLSIPLIDSSRKGNGKDSSQLLTNSEFAPCSSMYSNLPSLVFDPLTASQCFPSTQSCHSDARLGAIPSKQGSKPIPSVNKEPEDLNSTGMSSIFIASDEAGESTSLVVEDSAIKSFEEESSHDIRRNHQRTRSVELYSSDFQYHESENRRRICSQKSVGQGGRMSEVSENLNGSIVATDCSDEITSQPNSGRHNDRSPTFESSKMPPNISTTEYDASLSNQTIDGEVFHSSLASVEHLSRSLDLSPTFHDSMLAGDVNAVAKNDTISDQEHDIVPSSLAAALKVPTNLRNSNLVTRKSSLQRFLSGEADKESFLSQNDSPSIASLVDYLGLSNANDRQFLDELASEPPQSSFDELQHSDTVTLASSGNSAFKVRDNEFCAVLDPHSGYSAPTTAATTTTTTPTAGLTRTRGMSRDTEPSNENPKSERGQSGTEKNIEQLENTISSQESLRLAARLLTSRTNKALDWAGGMGHSSCNREVHQSRRHSISDIHQPPPKLDFDDMSNTQPDLCHFGNLIDRHRKHLQTSEERQNTESSVRQQSERHSLSQSDQPPLMRFLDPTLMTSPPRNLSNHPTTLASPQSLTPLWLRGAAAAVATASPAEFWAATASSAAVPSTPDRSNFREVPNLEQNRSNVAALELLFLDWPSESRPTAPSIPP